MESRDQAVLEALWALVARLSRPRAFDGPTEEIAARLAFIAGACAVAVFQVEGEQAQLITEHALPNDYLRRFPLRAWRALERLPGDLSEAASHRQPVHVASIRDDPRTLSLAGAARTGGLLSTFAAPVSFDGRLVGLLHGLFDARRSPTRARSLQRARALLGPALHRQRGEVPEGETIYDGPEGWRQLHQVHAVAGRYGRRYAVTVYQLERPEALARRYGPAFAEQALARLAEVVAEQCRLADVLARLGSFEVVAVLPESGQDGAFAQACRVVETFGAESFAHHSERLQVPIRAGISCWPDNGSSSGQASFDSASGAARDAEGSWVVAVVAKGAARAPERA